MPVTCLETPCFEQCGHVHCECGLPLRSRLNLTTNIDNIKAIKQSRSSFAYIYFATRRLFLIQSSFLIERNVSLSRKALIN